MMQYMRPNAEFNYQSLDLPFHYCCRKPNARIFKYKHNLLVNNHTINVNIGDVAQLEYWKDTDWKRMALERPKRDAFFESYSLNGKGMAKFFIPLYKTKEIHNFYTIKD